MKPSFALYLTDEGLALLHRQADGWLSLGEAGFDEGDLAAEMGRLRGLALAREPLSFATKLVIPRDQILFRRIAVNSPDPAQQEAEIKAALVGLTPYDVGDLLFDWSGKPPEVQVAVVARETLEEAEGFAISHRLNPVSFVAEPDDRFTGEAFFGLSSIAANLIPEGDRLVPDAEPIRLLLPEALPQPLPDAMPEAVQDQTPAPEAEALREPPEAEAAAEEPAPMPDAAEFLPEPIESALPEPEPEPELAEVQAEPELATPATAETESADLHADKAQAQDDPVAAQPDLFSQATAPEVPPAAPAEAPIEAPTEELQADSGSVPLADVTDAPVASLPENAPPDNALQANLSQDEPAIEPAQIIETPPAAVVAETTKPSATDSDAEAPMAVDVPDDDLPPPLPEAAMAAFSSRRRGDDGLAPPLSGVEKTGSKKPPKFSYDDPQPMPPRGLGDGAGGLSSIAGNAGKRLKRLGQMVTAQSIPGTRNRPAVPMPARPAAPLASSLATKAEPLPRGSTVIGGPVVSPNLAPPPLAAPPLTAPAAAPAGLRPAAIGPKIDPDSLARELGALNQKRVIQRGKPRYLGLILTGILLLFLAVVAAWSSLYLSGNTANESETQQASTDAAPASNTEDQPITAPEPLTDTQAQTAAAAQAEQPATAETAADPETPAPEAATSPEVATNSPAPQAQTLALSAMDAAPSSLDPAPLTAPVAESAPTLPLPAPAEGELPTVDASGLIVPTAEGIDMPDGFRLIAGKPPVLPPERPANAIDPMGITAAAAQADAAPAADPAITALQPNETFQALPDLAGARPAPRPASISPPAPATTTNETALPTADAPATVAPDDGAAIVPFADPALADARPAPRPESVLAAGAAAASLAAGAEAAGAGSPLAVAVSRIPAPRPRNLDRAIEAAVAAATQIQPEPEPEPQAEAALEGEVHSEDAEAEPEVASAAPRIPTKANVAKQATFKNAINLSKVNLIGVYGPDSNRHALIRTANGGYKKVKVGDRVDGGTVQAITATEVRYQKGGQLLKLAMPRG